MVAYGRPIHGLFVCAVLGYEQEKILMVKKKQAITFSNIGRCPRRRKSAIKAVCHHQYMPLILQIRPSHWVALIRHQH